MPKISPNNQVNPTTPIANMVIHPDIKTQNRFAVLSESANEDNLNLNEELERCVYVKLATNQGNNHPAKKARQMVTQNDELKNSLPQELLNEMTNCSEAELLEKLRKREAERRLAERLPQFLTEEEKVLSMDQLFRKWKIERQRRQNEQEELRISDFEPLGELTEEQKLLPRNQVARLINLRKNEVWASAMRQKGVDVLKCDVCGRLHTGEHRCIQTPWRTEGLRNSPITKNIILTQSPQGVRLRAGAIIDEEQVMKEYERLRLLKEEVEARRRLVQPNVPGLSTMDETPMTTTAVTTPPGPPVRQCF